MAGIGGLQADFLTICYRLAQLSGFLVGVTFELLKEPLILQSNTLLSYDFAFVDITLSS